MPTYLGKTVSDEELNALKDAYREGQKEVGGDEAVEQTDQIILDRMASMQVISPRAPSAYELGKADAGGS